MYSSMKIRKVIYNLIFWAVLVYSMWVILFKFATDFTSIKIIWAGPIAGMTALLYAALKSHDIMLAGKESDKLKEFSKNLVKEFLNIQKKELFLVTLSLIIVFPVLYKFINPAVAFCYLTGAISIFAAYFLSSLISINSNSKAAAVSETSIGSTHKVLLNSGLSAFLVPAGITMIVLPVLYYIYKDPNIICGFSLGVSLTSLLIISFGEIFAKASNLILQNGKEVKGAAITGSGIETSNSASDISVALSSLITASISLGALVLNLIGAFLPLTLAAAGIFCTIIASCFAKIKFIKNLKISLLISSITAIILYGIISYYLLETVFMPGYGLFYSVLIGIILSVALAFNGYFLTRVKKDELKGAEKEEALSRSVSSGFLPLALSAVAALASFFMTGGMDSYTAGFWGIGLSGITFLFVTAIMNACLGYKNTAGNALIMTEDEAKKDELKKMYNIGVVFSGMTKDVSSIAAVYSGLTILAAFAMIVNIEDMDILNPFVMCAAVFGASIPCLVPGLLNGSFVKAVKNVIKKEIFNGKEITDLISNKAFLGSLIPAMVVFITPLIVYFGIAKPFEKTLGIQSTGGVILGAVIAGGVISILSGRRDSLADNVKDLVFKETSNISSIAVLKLIALVALVFSVLLMPA